MGLNANIVTETALNRVLKHIDTMEHSVLELSFAAPGAGVQVAEPWGRWACSCGSLGAGYRFKSKQDVYVEFLNHITDDIKKFVRELRDAAGQGY